MIIKDIISVMRCESNPTIPKAKLVANAINIAGINDNIISKYFFLPANNSAKINIIEPKNGIIENSHCFFDIKVPFYTLGSTT